MTAYEVIVDELEKNCKEEMIFAHPEEIQKEYSMPSAFSAWKGEIKRRTLLFDFAKCDVLSLGQTK